MTLSYPIKGNLSSLPTVLPKALTCVSIFSIFMSNYVYLLFHGFCIIASLAYCFNRLTNHVASSGAGLSYDDSWHRERDKED